MRAGQVRLGELLGGGQLVLQVRSRALQDAIDRLTVDVGRGRSVGLGVSAGCATFPNDGRTPDELLVAADGRMYEDKSRRKRTGIDRQDDDDGEPPLRAAG